MRRIPFRVGEAASSKRDVMARTRAAPKGYNGRADADLRENTA
jgi:hypothetical protein